MAAAMSAGCLKIAGLSAVLSKSDTVARGGAD